MGDFIFSGGTSLYRPAYSDYYRPSHQTSSSKHCGSIDIYCDSRGMYHFQGASRYTPSIPLKHLTCRHWKCSASGCSTYPKPCQYAHYHTGYMSPPLPYQCYFWTKGQCIYHEDDCLYSHTLDALPSEEPRHFGYHRKLAISTSFTILFVPSSDLFYCQNQHSLAAMQRSPKLPPITASIHPIGTHYAD